MILILVFAIVALIPLAEIAFDHWRWNQDPPKDDKPISTILRLGLFGIFSFVMHITGVSIWYFALLLVGSGHLWIFDQGLNISRWKELKKMKLAYNFRIQHGIPMNIWHKITWEITKFMSKFTYHSNKGTDRIYSRIPGSAPGVEEVPAG